MPITAAMKGAKAIAATRAQIKIGSVDQTTGIPPGASKVTFRVPLTAGKARLKAWLLDEQGKGRGAYYASIERIRP